MKWYYQLGLIAVCLVLPLPVSGNRFLVYVVALTMINIMFAQDFSLLSSFLGLDNLALAGIAGFGAYTSAYLVMHMGFSFWEALPVAGIVAMGVGTAMGLPSLRLRGLSFIIFTIMIMLVLTQLFTDWSAFTNGDIGISSIPPPVLSIGGFSLTVSGIPFLYLCVAVLIPWMYIVKYLISGKNGLRLVSVRDDETLAAHLGVDTTGQKITTFAISAFAAGIFGALFAELIGFISPRTVDLLLTVQFFAMAYIGGKRTLAGPVIGAILLTALPNAFVTLSTYRNYATGILLVVVILFLPEGLIGLYPRFKTRFGKSAKIWQDAIPP